MCGEGTIAEIEKSQVRSIGHQISIFGQDRLHRRHQRPFLLVVRRRPRRFQNDLEGTRAQAGRRAQNPLVTLPNNSVARFETVDDFVGYFAD